MGNTETKVVDRPTWWKAEREQIEIDSWEQDGWEVHKILPDRLYFKKVRTTPKVVEAPKVTSPRYGDRKFSYGLGYYVIWDGFRWVRDWAAGGAANGSSRYHLSL